MYSRSPKAGNPIASILKSNVLGFPALFGLNPASNFMGFTVGENISDKALNRPHPNNNDDDDNNDNNNNDNDDDNDDDDDNDYDDDDDNNHDNHNDDDDDNDDDDNNNNKATYCRLTVPPSAVSSISRSPCFT